MAIRRVSGDESSATTAGSKRSDELSPVAGAARDFEHGGACQDGRQPLLDLPEIGLALGLEVDAVVLTRASGVIRLQGRTAGIHARPEQSMLSGSRHARRVQEGKPPPRFLA